MTTETRRRIIAAAFAAILFVVALVLVEALEAAAIGDDFGSLFARWVLITLRVATGVYLVVWLWRWVRRPKKEDPQ